MWNRDNVVNKLKCDCGQLANKVRGKHEFFKGTDCGRCYHKECGKYLVKKINRNERNTFCIVFYGCKNHNKESTYSFYDWNSIYELSIFVN